MGIDQKEFDVLQGQKSGSVAGLITRGPTATFNMHAKSMQEKEKADKEARFDDLLFLSTLETARDYHRQEKEALADQLREKYGDDFITVVAATYLTDEELTGLETDEDRLLALADKMLDKDGGLKPEYATHPEAQFVQHWFKEQAAAAAMEHVKNGDPIPVSVAKVLDDHSTALLHNETVSQNQEAQNVVESSVDNRLDGLFSSPSSSWGG